MVYGKSALAGSTATSARSARAPWPMSRRRRAAHRAGLANRERREVVVVDVALGLVQADAVDALLVGLGAERGDREHLGLAASEQRRAVDARKHANLAGDRADLGQRAPIWAGDPSPECWPGRSPSPAHRTPWRRPSRRSCSAKCCDDLFAKIAGGCPRGSPCPGRRSSLRGGCRVSSMIGLTSARRARRRDELALRLAGRPAELDSAARMIGWIASWAGFDRSSIVSSGTSLAPASTIRTASAVPATIRSRSEYGHLGHRRVDDDLAARSAHPHRADRAVERDVRDRSARPRRR